MCTTPKNDQEIRWAIRRDWNDIEIIQNQLPIPMTQEEYFGLLRQRDIVSLVVDRNKRDVIGHAIYRIKKKSLEIVHLAVRPDHWRSGVGSSMIERLKSKVIGTARRDRLESWVHESNVAMQCFLRSQGFMAIKTKKGAMDDGSDIYKFQWRE